MSDQTTSPDPALVQFLLDRYAEDADITTRYHRLLCMRIACDNEGCVWGEAEHDQMLVERVCTCGYPERLAADIQARRRIVEHPDVTDVTVRLLAMAYTDHADHLDAWRI